MIAAAVRPYILFTDVAAWSVVAMFIAFALYTLRKPHLREPWRLVFRSPMAMTTGIVLVFFASLGLADCVHFQSENTEASAEADKVIWNNEVKSVLDVVLAPLLENEEKTFSRPFAIVALSKESIETKEGSIRDYPLLKRFQTMHEERLKSDPTYAALSREDQLAEFRSMREREVRELAMSSLMRGLLPWVLIVIPLLALIAMKVERINFKVAICRIFKGGGDHPWWAIAHISGALMILFAFVILAGDQYHIMGTNKSGADVLMNAIRSIRVGLIFGVFTPIVMLPLAILLGISAGFFGGWIDDVIQYVYTTLNSIPGILLIAALVLMLDVYMDANEDAFKLLIDRTDARLLALCLIFGITGWTGLCRLLRAESLKLRELDYVVAARAFGVKNLTIILRHILPNAMYLVVITVVLQFSGLVLAEAILSYIGIGVDPAMVSWGRMITRATQDMGRDPVVWWPLFSAFTLMLTLVLAANLFADVVRDALDPKAGAEK